MRPALEHVCRKQTLRASLRKWFLRASLPYVSRIKVQRSLRCSSVHFLGICVMRTAAQCQILIFCRRKIFFFASRHYAAVLLTKVPKKCTDLHLSLLYISYIRNIWQIRSKNPFSSTRCLLPAALFKRWPQVCRVRITDCFVSTTTNSMKCLVNWIPLRILFRSKRISNLTLTSFVPSFYRSIHMMIPAFLCFYLFVSVSLFQGWWCEF